MTVQAKPSHRPNEQIEYERGLLEDARAEVRSGLRMNEAEVKAWLAGLDGDEELPIPELRAPRIPS